MCLHLDISNLAGLATLAKFVHVLKPREGDDQSLMRRVRTCMTLAWLSGRHFTGSFRPSFAQKRVAGIFFLTSRRSSLKGGLSVFLQVVRHV